MANHYEQTDQLVSFHAIYRNNPSLSSTLLHPFDSLDNNNSLVDLNPTQISQPNFLLNNRLQQ